MNYIKTERYPQWIYKYRALNDAFYKMLLNHSLWFSDSENFNDPYDCRVHIDFNNSEAEIQAYHERNGATPDAAKIAAKSTIEKPNDYKKIFNDKISKAISKSGICCFSENKDSILMWSHYSDSHKGVCLKFDILKDPAFFIVPVAVNYKKEYGPIKYIGNEEGFLKNLIITKSKINWGYEEEIRILKPTKSGLFEFKKESLIEITFGYNTEETEIKHVKKLLRIRLGSS